MKVTGTKVNSKIIKGMVKVFSCRVVIDFKVYLLKEKNIVKKEWWNLIIKTYIKVVSKIIILRVRGDTYIQMEINTLDNLLGTKKKEMGKWFSQKKMQPMKVNGKMIKEKVLALRYIIVNLIKVDSKDISKIIRNKAQG